MVTVEAQQYAIEPSPSQKFRPTRVKEVIGHVLRQKLVGVAYHADNTSSWAREIADEIKARLKEENWERYKFVVQVLIGEQRGEGIRMGCRCFWDANSDSFAQDVFSNESIFCVAAAYGLYLY